MFSAVLPGFQLFCRVGYSGDYCSEDRLQWDYCSETCTVVDPDPYHGGGTPVDPLPRTHTPGTPPPPHRTMLNTGTATRTPLPLFTRLLSVTVRVPTYHFGQNLQHPKTPKIMEFSENHGILRKSWNLWKLLIFIVPKVPLWLRTRGISG